MMIVQSCSISIHDAHLGFHLSPVEVELMLMQPIGSSLGFDDIPGDDARSSE